jgi:hypothetical protein
MAYRGPFHYGSGGGHFKRNLKVYGPAFLQRPDLASALERGDKVVLFQGLLRDLEEKMEEFATSGNPLILEAVNTSNGKKTHVGVLEFSGDEHNVAYLPSWVMHNLGAEDGALVQFQLRQLPRLKFIRMRPSDGSFVASVTEPKLALEEALRSFTAVTEGDELVIHHNGAPFTFAVLEVKPMTGSKAANLINADCEIEFVAAEGSEGEGGGGAAAPAGFAPSFAGAGAGVGGGRAPSPAVGGGRAPSPALPSVPRKIEVGESLTGELRAGASAAFFTLVMRPSYVGTHGLRFTFTSSVQGGPSIAGAPVLHRPSPALSAGAGLPPLATDAHAPMWGGTSASPSKGSTIAATRPPTVPTAGAGAGGVSLVFLGGSGRLGGDPAPDAAAFASLSHPVPRGSLEADLFVSVAATKPSRRLFTWAEVGEGGASRSLELMPAPVPPPAAARIAKIGSADPLPVPADGGTGSVILYAALEASEERALAAGAVLTYCLSVEAVPLPPRAGEPAGTDATASARAGAGTTDCGTCGASIPSHALVSHSAYCARNNARCTLCGVVTSVRAAASHLHCCGDPEEGGSFPTCAAVLASVWEQEKHEATFHSPFPCEACGQRVRRETYALHRSEACALRSVPCCYCSMPLQMQSRWEHEEKCGARTLKCELCAALVPRKRMAAHQASLCGVGSTPPFNGYVVGSGDLPPFALDGAGGADALGLGGLWGERTRFPPPRPAARPMLPPLIAALRDVTGSSAAANDSVWAVRDDEDAEYIYSEEEGELEMGESEEQEGGGEAAGAGAPQERRSPAARRARDPSVASLSSSSTETGEGKKRRKEGGTARAAAPGAVPAPAASAPAATRERCSVCQALVDGFDDLQIHLLTACAARAPDASPAARAELRSLLDVYLGSEAAEALDREVAEHMTVVAPAPVERPAAAAAVAAPAGAPRVPRRLHMCPSCGLVMQAGQGEAETQEHLLAACLSPWTDTSAAWRAAESSFAPLGSVPGTRLAVAAPDGGAPLLLAIDASPPLPAPAAAVAPPAPASVGGDAVFRGRGRFIGGAGGWGGGDVEEEEEEDDSMEEEEELAAALHESMRGGLVAAPPPAESAVALLVDMGFEREAAVAALRATGGNVAAAAAQLLAAP